ncbi:MAG: low molecular weight protein arginine phosphatase [Candidatus Omnitrophica bacterium]|nr:low molecular weight protein arginine phosphatase [Candidatus Omnitrophota bacterium]
MSEKRILFVCTGNSCRSVMAERYLKHLLRQAGMDTIQVESAGVFAVEGMGATSETQRVLRDVGADAADHRARTLTPSLAQGADLILTMEQFQLEEVLRRAPSAHGKTHLLKRYGLAPSELPVQVNIPDPIGKPLEVYEVCFSEIREAVERVARSLGVRT